MASSRQELVLSFLLCLYASAAESYAQDYSSFLHCLSLHTPPPANVSQLVYTPNTSSYSLLLQSSIRNLRFAAPDHEPLLIITPADESHVQASVICCREQGLLIRVRSGGHDYEGLSYRSEDDRPFAIVDLVNLRTVAVDLDEGAAWAQAGATLGELYYRIAEKSGSYGFPAGICPTVGIGGHISGGGFGTMLRKNGLAADNVLDAKLVDVNGRLLDKASMGEDLFWAIRGGGGASFGVIVSWTVRLVPVPPTLTAFTLRRTFCQGAVELVDKWQHIAPALHENLFIRVIIQAQAEGSGNRGVEAVFNSLFLGECGELLQLMSQRFPELGLTWNDCKEMDWAHSALYFEHPTDEMPLETLLDRGSTKPEKFFKAKSDFVKEPIPVSLWERISARFTEDGAGALIMDPFGGKMDSIAGSATPFPHRQGNLYCIQYYAQWREVGAESSQKHIGWVRSLYDEMGPYVSMNPRAAYVNYRDLDLGKNEEEGGVTSYSKAEAWGRMYFEDNFKRLAYVKGRVDPGDFFRNEQSIPPLVGENGASCSGWGGLQGTLLFCIIFFNIVKIFYF